eukprot:CAMPEP_0194484660 /NCGR_PEP_ID=MMETSP0253-20130528/5925_1 /TAXON_ID=2966 /ORGANISM="Noctiluca scintillans" /LENGTH=152 /DNA_ID=CAMNT_0039324505 /DNA_START=272 /DNA_END=730 /DNA_ORIENTATION=+
MPGPSSCSLCVMGCFTRDESNSDLTPSCSATISASSMCSVASLPRPASARTAASSRRSWATSSWSPCISVRRNPNKSLTAISSLDVGNRNWTSNCEVVMDLRSLQAANVSPRACKCGALYLTVRMLFKIDSGLQRPTIIVQHCRQDLKWCLG